MAATPPPIPEGYEVAGALLGPDDLRARTELIASSIRDGLDGVPDDLLLVGIRRGGVHLAERLAELLGGAGHAVPVGTLDISLYRDDLHRVGPNPIVGPSSIPVEIDGTQVVLVDDVLYTGRTIRAALDALLDYGRPKRVMLAVLVDRGHRELPIRADFCGLEVETRESDQVEVRFAEEGGDETALLLRRIGPSAEAGRG